MIVPRTMAHIIALLKLLGVMRGCFCGVGSIMQLGMDELFIIVHFLVQVNNGDVDLVRSSPDITPTCHSDVNPFYVRLVRNETKRGVPLQSSKKRAKSPLVKGHGKIKSSKGKENRPAVNSSPQGSTSSCRFSLNLGKPSRARCTPEGKKRRKSRLVAPLDMHFVG